jgi:hypothetical protein
MNPSRIKSLGVAAWSLLGTLLLLGAFLWILNKAWLVVPPIVMLAIIICSTR